MTAQCAVKEIGGSNTFNSSNEGSNADDLIICEDGDKATATVKGFAGDDMILIYDASSGDDIEGDGLASTGDDTIIVFASAAVDMISGDVDTLGSSPLGD